MTKLFVKKEVDINAPAIRVWDVLTKPEYTDQWAPEFVGGEAEFHIESDWKMGSPVLWKNEEGKVLVEGNVTAIQPNKLLRFTVFDSRSTKPKVKEEDGITYVLDSGDHTTTLRVTHGDFSVLKEGERYHNMSEQVWNKVLPKVKQIAETRDDS